METTTENSLVQIVEQSGLEKTKGQILLEKFSGYFKTAAEIEVKLNQLGEEDYKEAGEIRKSLKNSRVEAEKIRKELKESSLREGQTIDSIGRIIKNLIEPLEEKAEKIEKAKEIKAAQEKEARKIERMGKLATYNVAAEPNLIADMTDEMFTSYLSGVEKDYQLKLEAERKAEEERIERERKEAEEREAQRLENIRLKEEAEAREKEMQAEREKAEKERKELEEKAAKEKAAAEAKLKAEKYAREKVERELKLKQELEAKEKREREEKEAAEKAAKEEAERTAALAPKKEKLSTWVNDFSISFPAGLDNDKTAKEIIEKFHSFKNWALEQVKNIK